MGHAISSALHASPDHACISRYHSGSLHRPWNDYSRYMDDCGSFREARLSGHLLVGQA